MDSSSAVLDLIGRYAAIELAGDVEAYRELLASDFVGIGYIGIMLDAQQWAQRHRTDLTNHEFQVTDPHVRIYGDTAVITAVQDQRTTVMGHNASGSFRLGVVAVKTDAAWRIAHIQLSGPIRTAAENASSAR
jgi:ketosteroid isomerase-like protein